MEVLVEYLTKGFMVMLMVSMPCVLVAAAVGLVVGILQAVTQVQEQTIAAAPKIALVFLSIVVLGGYFLKVLTNYLTEGTHIAFNVVTKSDDYVLNSDYYKYTRPFASEMKDGVNKASQNRQLLNQNLQWDKKAKKQPVYVKAKQVPANDPNFIEKMKIQQNR